MLSRFTFWKLDRLEKEKSLESEDFLEEALSDDTPDTPVYHNIHRLTTRQTLLYTTKGITTCQARHTTIYIY